MRIDVGLIRKVRASCGVDLAKLFTQEGLAALADPVQLVDVLWVMCESQANAQRVSPEEFAASLVGDEIEAAAGALAEASIDFLPSSRQEAMRKLLSRATELAAAQWATVEAKLDSGLQRPSSGAIS